MEFSTATLKALVDLARKGEGRTRPNPPVGAFVLDAQGVVVGKGYHRRAGMNHAEVEAIADWKKRNPKAAAHTLLVTLEPCSRPGRVGACTDAIIAAEIPRVVYLCRDPNPKNRDKAKRTLAHHGIECRHLKFAPAEELIRPFAKHVTTGMPYVTVKLAMSLDGRISDSCGDARWVSSEKSRKRTGKLRERVDAIMVGGETVRRDNPSLLPHGKANPHLVRVVVSKSGKLPPDAQVFSDGKNETLVYRDAVEAVRDLGRRGMMHVLCEGGLKLATSLAEAGLVDEWLTVLCPKVIGTRRIGEAVVFGGGKTEDVFVCSRA